MQRSDVPLKVHRLSFQPVPFIWILLLLHLQFGYLSASGKREKTEKQKENFSIFITAKHEKDTY